MLLGASVLCWYTKGAQFMLIGTGAVTQWAEGSPIIYKAQSFILALHESGGTVV